MLLIFGLGVVNKVNIKCKFFFVTCFIGCFHLLYYIIIADIKIKINPKNISNTNGLGIFVIR